MPRSAPAQARETAKAADATEAATILQEVIARVGDQGRLRRAYLSLRPHPDETNHRRMRTLMPEGIVRELIRGSRPRGFQENGPGVKAPLLGFFLQSDGESRFAGLRRVVED